MKIVTIASDLDQPFLQRLLIPSCGILGLDLVILHSTKDGFRHSDKRSIITGYLARHVEADELIVFTDAYDTLFVRGQQHIEEAYKTFAQPVVFSAEVGSWPLGSLGFAILDAPPTPPYPFLNSGGYIGPAGVLLDLLDRYPQPPSDRFGLLRKLRKFGYDTNERYAFSDQYYWTLVQLLEGETVALDHTALLFENLGPPIPDVWDLQILLGHYEFYTQDRKAASYGQERARLEEVLKTPSQAAHIHFSNPMGKAAALDLLDEGKLPDWLREVTGSTTPAARAATVVAVDHLVGN
ncbi:glycosyltransferase domain-containing protein [Micromonospora sp. NPDC049230]|uniref:glycosyltransferase domain-containing protein n=1 Tax=Micromonospora sp. NPDC049230 TaxID=3155502 RepID=UPI003407D9FC